MDTFGALGAALTAANDTYDLYHTHENSDTEGELLPSSSDSEEFFLPTSKKRKLSEASAKHIQFTRSPISSPRISPISPPTSQSATHSSPSGFGSDGSHTEGDSLLLSSPSQHASPGISDDDPDDFATHIPTCSVCLQPYTQRAYIYPCFHSFCFICIVQWTELSGLCPMCKRYSEFLVYDADVNLGTFKRWHWQRTDAKASDRNGGRSAFVNGSRSSSSPDSLSSSSKSKVNSGMDGKPLELLARRRAVYTRSLYPTAAYPVSPFFANATYLTPTQLARIIPFIRRDLKAILEDDYELLIEEHVVSVLMQEHETKGKKAREQVVEMLRSWLEINSDESKKGVASRFVEEVTAFAKSGMDVGKWDRVVKYRSMDEM